MTTVSFPQEFYLELIRLTQYNDNEDRIRLVKLEMNMSYPDLKSVNI